MTISKRNLVGSSLERLRREEEDERRKRKDRKVAIGVKANLSKELSNRISECPSRLGKRIPS
jgi:hypothetical protein